MKTKFFSSLLKLAMANCMLLIFSTTLSIAQPTLLPSIGVGPLPSNNDPVCDIPWYLGSFDTSGLDAGDMAYDFTLYDLNGDSLNLKDALSKGRPVLLVNGSYTCPVYRRKLQDINDVVTTYAGQLDVYIIYTVEAHPDIDTSVYYGYVHTGAQNIDEGILYRQPTTYGERKVIVGEMLAGMPTLAPVFIDGPCNNWWEVYGPAPNNSYLINTDGIVFAKHGWFDRYPDNIYCDIDSLLGTTSGNCTSSGGTSNYTFQLTSSDTVYGDLGTTISIDGELTNTGADDILIYASRIENDLPTGWASAMCIDVCYSPNTDSVVFLLEAGVTQPIHVYFFTSADAPAEGHVKMGFKNLSNTSNKNVIDAYGISTSLTGVYPQASSSTYFSISPNPFSSSSTIYSNQPFDKVILTLYNSIGEQVKRVENISGTNIILNRDNLPGGLYFLSLTKGNKIITTKKLIITN